MKFGIYDFFCQVESQMILPDYKGSTLRGGLGQALRQLVCTLSRQECKNCLLNQRCIYALFFETSVCLKEVKDRRFPMPPKPYVIEPSVDPKKMYQKGDYFTFRLLLFGDANNHLPYIVYAFDQMGETGLGKKIDGNRGKYILKSVKTDDHLIYSDQDRQIVNREPTFLQLNNFISNQTISKVTVNLETPLRFKYNNRFIRKLSFHVLVRAMVRRISSLFNYYGEGEPDLNYKQLIKDAEQITCENSNIQWFDWSRYSSRQGQSMKLGGITGSATFSGSLSPFMSLLKCCAQLHLGKQTTFGLGKMSVTL